VPKEDEDDAPKGLGLLVVLDGAPKPPSDEDPNGLPPLPEALPKGIELVLGAPKPPPDEDPKGALPPGMDSSGAVPVPLNPPVLLLAEVEPMPPVDDLLEPNACVLEVPKGDEEEILEGPPNGLLGADADDSPMPPNGLADDAVTVLPPKGLLCPEVVEPVALSNGLAEGVLFPKELEID